MQTVSPAAERAIISIARFQYVTSHQLVRLGVSKDISHVRATLREMRRGRQPLVLEIKQGTFPTLGRQASLYVLTKHGRDLALEILEPDEVRFHPRVRVLTTDYLHRVACVDFAITVHEWAEANSHAVEWYHAYYDPFIENRAGRRLRKRTAVDLSRGYLEPDAVFMLTDADGVRRLFAYEYYRGLRTDRVFKQLEVYLSAIGEAAIQKAYGYDKAVRILCTFDDQNVLDLARKRLQTHQGFVQRSQWFFLAQQAEAVADFPGAWQRISGEGVPLF